MGPFGQFDILVFLGCSFPIQFLHLGEVGLPDGNLLVDHVLVHVELIQHIFPVPDIGHAYREALNRRAGIAKLQAIGAFEGAFDAIGNVFAFVIDIPAE